MKQVSHVALVANHYKAINSKSISQSAKNFYKKPVTSTTSALTLAKVLLDSSRFCVTIIFFCGSQKNRVDDFYKVQYACHNFGAVV